MTLAIVSSRRFFFFTEAIFSRFCAAAVSSSGRLLLGKESNIGRNVALECANELSGLAEQLIVRHEVDAGHDDEQSLGRAHSDVDDSVLGKHAQGWQDLGSNCLDVDFGDHS